MLEAHWFTTLGITFLVLFVGVYWFYVLPLVQAKKAALITVIFGALLTTGLLYDLPNLLGPFRNLLVVFNWIVPAALVWINRDHFRDLDQRNLVALQIFRVLGGFFLVEMARGLIPGSFAWLAGLGDVTVGCIAACLCLFFKTIPRWGILLVIVLGLLDFASAMFFGFTSSPGPLQLFAFGFHNRINTFPIGIIPFFLVPYAIVFHILSLINLPKS
ncbi:MAG: hypothetical protein LLG04_05610 [Parachlamydia sp.]|nr:hypothetical protein [Parachlamydia sp.]